MKKSGRVVYLDLLRIFAILGVVFIHASQSGQSAYLQSISIRSFAGGAQVLFTGLALFAVPLFIMLSGVFMLDPSRDVSVKKIYTKKIPPLLIALLFWSVAYALLQFRKELFFSGTPSVGLLKIVFVEIIRGCSILWFIPVIIGLYMITPLLRIITQHASKRMLQYLLLLYFVPTTVRIIASLAVRVLGAPETLIIIATKIPLELATAWTAYFILGYYLKTYEVKSQHRRIVYITTFLLFVLQLGFAYFASLRAGALFDYLDYVSLPSTFFMAISIFLFFKYEVSKISFSEKPQKFIAKVSSLIFGVYLSHLFIIFLFEFRGTNGYTALMSPLITIPVYTGFIFVLSLLVSWALSKIPVLGRCIV